MSYIISLKVNEQGKIEAPQDVLEISVFKESQRVTLLFFVDPSIDSTYHYLKFTHEKTSYLYRVNNNQFNIPKAITAWEGIWEMSFVCCDSPANSDNTITSNYIYASEPYPCVVKKGNLGNNASTEEQVLLKNLVEGTFDTFEIPNTASVIAPYFLSNMANGFKVTVPASIKQIKDHIFYQSGCYDIVFEEGSQLLSMDDYGLYRITNLGDIKFPRSLNSWGKYNMSGCGSGKIEFESNSQLKTLGSYALWTIPNVKVIRLPDHLTSFSDKTNIIKDCPLLEEIWFPNTITVVIPQNAITGCPNLTKITLQSGFNVSANFANCTNLSHDSIVAMFAALKNQTTGSKELKLGSENLAKVSQEEKDIALNKGWSLA